jgi:L-aminopeptidase/D-esterase-like protein
MAVRPRAREAGVPFAGTPSPLNAITDVGNVEVGMATLIEGEDVRTGVTAIHPRGRDGTPVPCVAGFHSFNGNGEMTGVSWIREAGMAGGPICITSTHAVGAVHQAVIRWTNRAHPAVAGSWLLPVVGETWDGYLNDVNGEHVTVEHAVAAIESAARGAVLEGSVGGGTGMNCYHFKGGSGTASRVVELGAGHHVVGVFVQANFGARRELVVAGVPVGVELLDDDPMQEAYSAPPGAGSIIGVAITTVPLLPNQCEALARRLAFGVARTGTSGSHYSGDLFLALSLGGAEPAGREARMWSELPYLSWRFIDAVYEAAVQAAEEAVLNALFVNEEMTGRGGHRSPALPVDRVMAILRRRGAV